MFQTVGVERATFAEQSKGVSHDKWRWGAEEEEHVQQIEKKPCRQQKYRQRTDKEANVSKDRLINDTIRIDGVKTNK